MTRIQLFSCIFALALPWACAHPDAIRDASDEPVAAPSTSPTTIERPADPTSLLVRAARLQPLTKAQRAIVETIAAELEDSRARARAARTTFEMDLAAGVRAGEIDRDKLQADEATIERVSEARLAETAMLLDRLHTTLTLSQRIAAVDGARSSEPAEGPIGGGPGAPDAGVRRRLDRLTKELSLDAQQRSRVERLLLRSPDGMSATDESDRHRRKDSVFVAFEGDAFDARAALASAVTKSPRQRLDDHVQLVSELLYILRPEQRSALADLLERAVRTDEHAAGHP